MTQEVRIPKLGVAMSEGTLVAWMVGDGDLVTDGQPLYVIETEKVENEVPSAAAGRITLLAEPGEVYPVGHLIAQIEPIS